MSDSILNVPNSVTAIFPRAELGVLGSGFYTRARFPARATPERSRSIPAPCPLES